VLGDLLSGAVKCGSLAWVGVTGRDLDVSEVDAGIEHGRDEGMTRACEGVPR
jgi:hypothetical protein